jgi:hypothetical protein
MVRGMFREEMETKEAYVDFCRCPFCACCFMSIQDLERHITTFGNNKETHYENVRRTHDKVEYG